MQFYLATYPSSGSPDFLVTQPDGDKMMPILLGRIDGVVQAPDLFLLGLSNATNCLLLALASQPNLPGSNQNDSIDYSLLSDKYDLSTQNVNDYALCIVFPGTKQVQSI